jgi:WD40 repeat protein
MKRNEPFASEKLIVTLSESASTICSNKDGSRIAIAGRRIFTINDATNQMTEIANLRNLPHKQLNLNYSSNHIQWNPRDESQLASAPTNSSVVLWDLNKRTKSKLSYIYENVHQRAVNRVCYHPREPNTLLSGSQDSTMACFDTREKRQVSLYRGPDSVRDVQYNPHSDYFFAACFENGYCQIWDRRKSEFSMIQIPAHAGPAYSCAWHPEQEHCIVSAGRDKTIKVYNTQYTRPKEAHIINALFSVARVKWRTNHKHHLSSCSHLLDNTVAVWDIRRPFMQFGTFSEHTDDVTDFMWLSEDVLVSCAKDSRLVKQHISVANHQTDKATPVSISLKPDGGVALSFSDSTHQRTKTHTAPILSRNPIQFRKQEVDPYQQRFLCHTSYLHEFINNEEVWLSDFKYFAKSYQLEGSPIDKLCDRNHQVCLDRNRVDDSRTWLMIKLLFCGDNPHCSTLGLLPLQVSKEKEKERNEKESVQESNSKENGSISEPSAQGGPLIVGNSNNNDDDVQDISGVLEFFEYNESDSESNASETISHSHQELELPKEPFQLRKKISNQGQFLEVPDVDDISTHSGGLSFASSGRRSSMTTQASGSTQKPLPPGLTPVIWDFSGQVIEMLKYYAQKGDVQMSVTVVLVLRDKIVKLIPQLLLLQWFNSYIG